MLSNGGFYHRCYCNISNADVWFRSDENSWLGFGNDWLHFKQDAHGDHNLHRTCHFPALEKKGHALSSVQVIYDWRRRLWIAATAHAPWASGYDMRSRDRLSVNQNSQCTTDWNHPYSLAAQVEYLMCRWMKVRAVRLHEWGVSLKAEFSPFWSGQNFVLVSLCEPAVRTHWGNKSFRGVILLEWQGIWSEGHRLVEHQGHYAR